MKRNKKRTQTLESAKNGLEIIFNGCLHRPRLSLWKLSYNFHYTWQILGDKVGWFTARYLAIESGRSLLKQIEDDYNVKAKFIHVIRNPFDNIATIAMRLLGLRTGQHIQKVSRDI